MPVRLVAFDMDGTLVDAESSWGWVHAYFGERNDEGLRRFLNDEIDDEEFMQSDLALWRKHRPDLTAGDLASILSTVPLMPGAVELVRGLTQHGIMTAIISGGIDLLAERVGRELGIERVYANGFATDASGRIGGNGIVRVPIRAKREVLARLQEELGVAPEDTAAVGNSDIDVGLFVRSRIRVAFLPVDDHVRANATHQFDHKDLRALLPLLLERGPHPAGAVSRSGSGAKQPF